MAHNKSNKSTPSSRSGYFNELTASAGKQSSFLLPVRIKVTPNSYLAPLSDGKKNPPKMLQPVLIKDLFQSTKKDKQNSTIMSVSTQKKKAHSLRSTQPYLITQSCSKSKDEDEKSTFFNRKSCGGNKVRRQLYQNLDSPKKNSFEGKEIINKTTKAKKKTIQNSEEITKKNIQPQNRNRKSLLLPPNSIKNSFLKKSGTNFSKPSNKQSIKCNVKTASYETKAEKQKIQMNKVIEPENELNMEIDLSSPNIDKCDEKKIPCTKDNFTMTSPILERKVLASKSLSDLSKFERPSVIMNPLKIKSVNKCTNDFEPPSLEMQNLSIYKSTCNCIKPTVVASEHFSNTEFDFNGMNNLKSNNLTQFKSFLEQSIQTCEDQIFKFRQMLNFVNNVLKTAPMLNSLYGISPKINEKFDLLNKTVNIQQNSNDTNTFQTSIEEEIIANDTLTAVKENMDENQIEKINSSEVEEKLSIPLKILVNTINVNPEANEMSTEILNDVVRLSTIGEVSYENDESSKYEKRISENKENLSDFINNINLNTPRTSRTPRRRSVANDSSDSQGRRRSARLAVKRMSLSMLSDLDKQDSFTQLENELNVVHEPLPSKSLPASPTKPMTPGIKQWDKKIERPLKEYMALKMNGTFLVTPDVKKFQSRLESTDTPHSRKSLSRKIFMELCDLYAESPEPK